MHNRSELTAGAASASKARQHDDDEVVDILSWVLDPTRPSIRPKISDESGVSAGAKPLNDP